MRKILSNEEIAEAVFEYLEKRNFNTKSFHIQYSRNSRFEDTILIGIAEGSEISKTIK